MIRCDAFDFVHNVHGLDESPWRAVSKANRIRRGCLEVGDILGFIARYS